MRISQAMNQNGTHEANESGPLMWKMVISGSRHMAVNQPITCVGESGARLLGGAMVLRGWKVGPARFWRKRKTTKGTAKTTRPTTSAEMNVDVLFACSLVSWLVADIFDGGRGLRAWALYQATAARIARCEGREGGCRV